MLDKKFLACELVEEANTMSIRDQTRSIDE